MLWISKLLIYSLLLLTESLYVYRKNNTLNPNTNSNVVETKKNNTKIIKLILQAQKSIKTDNVKKNIS